MKAISVGRFNGLQCEVYSDNKEIFMTRSQIGKALGYENPSDSIELIHRRHKDRLDKYSVTFKLTGTDGKYYNTYLYSQRGIMEICRWSRQPLADKFMDYVWDIIEAYSNGTLVAKEKQLSSTLLTEEFVREMIDNRIEALKQELLSVDTKLQSPLPSRAIIRQNKIETMRETIKPLAEIFDDHSNGYNCTFRKVYSAMGIGWKYRQSRYKNEHNNKNIPSKLNLIVNDDKLLKLFNKTINSMLSNIQKNA